MVNFSIPYTGSSGHIIGSTLLAILLGPNLAFLSISLILTIQALFFNDGGLLVLGCNIFNMGVLACFVIYPFIYKPLKERKMELLGAFLASICALELGSIGVLAEAYLSNSTVDILNFASFMLFIHFAVGIFEGLFTSLMVFLVQKFGLSNKIKASIFSLTLILSLIISNYASMKPDGLEWSLIKISDSFIEQTNGIIYNLSETIQAKTAILLNLPDILANLSGIILITLFAFLLSKILNLKTFNKPSFPCLASRIPYNELIDKEKILMADRAENILYKMGFFQYRVRIIGKTAKIEILPNDFQKLINKKDEILKSFFDIGFKDVLLDLKGYRQGSLNEGIIN